MFKKVLSVTISSVMMLTLATAGLVSSAQSEDYEEYQGAVNYAASSTSGNKIELNTTLVNQDEEHNSIQVNVSDLINSQSDKIKQIKVEIEAAKTIGKFQGAYGVSVQDGFAAQTSDHWYQSDNFEYNISGTSDTIVIDIDSNLADYIAYSGNFFFGMWWCDAGSVTVKSMEAVVEGEEETTTIPEETTPSTNDNKVILNTQLVNQDEEHNSVQVLISDLIDSPSDKITQIKVEIEATKTIGKFQGAYGVSVQDGFAAQTSDHWYQSDNFEYNISGTSDTIVIDIDSNLADYIAYSGNFFFGMWWCDAGSVTVKSMEAVVEGEETTVETTATVPVTTTEPVVTTTVAETTTEPVATTTVAETTTEPVATTTVAETTTEPVVTTTVAETTTEPVVTTTVAETTTEPVVTTTVAETTTEPVVTTTVAETTTEPVVTTTVAETTTDTIDTDKLMYGDVNLDGVINISDVIILNRNLVGSASLNATQRENANCVYDTLLDVNDSFMIMRFISRIIPSSSLGEK